MRIITLLLTLVLVISVGFVSCTKDDSQKDANSSANDDKSSATVENSTDENCACSEDGVLDALSVDEIGSEEASGTDGSLDKPATDGIDLIYYEDFENRSLHKTNDTVFKALGWKEESLLTGAVSNNTTTYKIVDFADSRRLYLRNNKSGGGDSYVTVLSSAVMGKFHEENYTYQYDIVYEDASASSRYVALVSDYNGKFFNSFHLRNGGTANNQCYAYGEWHTYDSAPASDGEDSIVSKLLGLEYDSDVQALKYIELSIKYVVDWENGNSVYIRINSDGYPGSGVWTLVSKMDMESDAASYFIPEQSGGALVLKTGGKQNAYVDNIIVWRGTGEEPADKTVMLADVYKSECTGHLIEGKGDSCTDPQRCVYCEEVLLSAPHDYEIVGNDKRCKVCGVLENNLDSTSWFLLNVPQYKGGVYSKKAYLCGQGIENDSFAYDDESPMMIVSETDRDEFLTYCDSLSAEYGYEKAYELERDGNVYAQFSYKDSLIYTYFTEAVSEVRIIDDRNSDCVTNDFGYTYQKTETDTTVLYQIGLPMNSMGADISNSSEKKINCGMMYAIKLADDSVIVIDGGGQQQFDEAQCDFLMSFLREITGTKEGEQVRVSAWYITHGHSDHMAGFCVFSKKYHTEIQLERIMFNFASVYSSDSTQADAISNYNKLLDYIDTYYSDDDVKFVKMHTGQTFNIADVSINIIYTHEDLVDPKTAKTEVAEDYNNGSTVAYFVIDGKKFMLTGDINRVGAKVLMEFNSAETLKSDVLQCAHHCLNYLSEMYDLTQAPCVLMPQSPAGCIANSTRKAILEYLKKYAADENIFYASVGTYGFSFTDEGYEQVYFADCVGGEYTGWGW